MIDIRECRPPDLPAVLERARKWPTRFCAAEYAGQFVSAGRLEPLGETDFAGIWGVGYTGH
jgi:hypothetical protein